MKKILFVLLFCLMVLTINSTSVINVNTDVMEGEIYPEPTISQSNG